MRKIALLIAWICFFNIAHAPTMEAQILASPVFDVANNAVGAVAKAVAIASEAIRKEILPWKERISKVQDFFKKASEKVSVVVKNLKMTNDLIQTEKNIEELFTKTTQQLDSAENFEDKWKHRWILAQLYLKASSVFNLFDITLEEGQGVMDDENRIILIRDSLKKARKIYYSMKIAVRRTNKQIHQLNRTKRELEVFDRLFGDSR